MTEKQIEEIDNAFSAPKRDKEMAASIEEVHKSIVVFSKWISIKDGIPVKDTFVLVFNGEIEYGRYDGKEFLEAYYNGDYWPDSLYDVTHWMPLPEPPTILNKL